MPPSSTGDEIGRLDSDNTELAMRLRLTIARLARSLRQQATSGLTPSQQAMLATLNDRGSHTPTQLANREQISPPSITKAIAHLEDEGLVSRRPDDTDRRLIHISITETGTERLTWARDQRNAWLVVKLDELDDEAREKLRVAVEVLEAFTEPPATEVQ